MKITSRPTELFHNLTTLPGSDSKRRQQLELLYSFFRMPNYASHF